MEIRKADTNDMEELLRLRFAFLDEFRHIDGATKEKLEPELRRYFANHLGKPDFAALLGIIDGEPKVSAFFTVVESPPNDQYPNGKIAYVFNVYTPAALRGKGYATTLMRQLVQTAKEMGVTAINLNASPAGRPIYEKLGFNVLTDTAMRLQMHD